MGNNNRIYPWGCLAGVLLSAVLILGCAGNETVQKDFPLREMDDDGGDGNRPLSGAAAQERGPGPGTAQGVRGSRWRTETRDHP